MNNYALITGSTCGIGKSLAEKFAQEKINLLLVSRDIVKLNQQAEWLNKQYEIDVIVIESDLTENNSAEAVYEKVKQLDINVQYLINNAGFSECGSFLETDFDNEIAMINIHITCITKMMKLFIPDMIKNKCGYILNIGSIGSYMPCPYNSVYGAAKGYVLLVSNAIGYELKNTSVSITTLCPGATNTSFATRAGIENSLLFKYGVMEADKVARIGYNALIKRKRYAIPGVYNKLLVFSSKIMPLSISNYLTKIMLQ